MNILGIDTANAKKLLLVLKTSVYTDTRDLVVGSLETEIIPEIEKLLQEHQLSLYDIDSFVIGSGPGSFMGLRIGFSVVRTWAWFGDKSLALVSSLEILALSSDAFRSNTLVVPCIDAKMNKIFSSAFFEGKRVALDTDVLPEVWAEKVKQLACKLEAENILLIGSGAGLLHEFLPSVLVFQQDAKAFGLEAAINKDLKFFKASEDRLEHAVPQYLRLSAAEQALKNSKVG